MNRTRASGPGHPERTLRAAQRAFEAALAAERRGDLRGAASAYGEFIGLQPGSAEGHNNLANVLLALGRNDEALHAAERAFSLNPADPFANVNLGRARLGLGQPEKAVPFLRSGLRHLPEVHELRRMLADALLDSGHLGEAAALFAELEARALDDPALLGLMATFYRRARMPVQAERCFLRLLELDPLRAGTYNDLAILCLDTAQFSRACDLARRGLELEPGAAVLWNTLGNALQSTGRMEEAIAAFRKGVEIAPANAVGHSNLLFCLHYPSPPDPASLFEEHRQWASRHAPPARAARTFPNSAEPKRRLKIGYLSPDLRRHSVAFFLEPLLERHDRAQFELWAYADVRHPDEVTARLRSRFDHWRSVVGLDDARIAALIREDGIDVLVDLAGHAGNHHAAALGFKPAPVIATWLGYPDTTGIEAVDYRVSDWIADPAGAEALCVETLVRLPEGFHCYRPEPDVPQPVGPRAGTGVTFGSFNREFKVSERTFDLWCRLLRELPDSRIVMKSVAGHDPETRDYQLGQFARRGVSHERVDLVGFIADPRQHLASYAQVDIALDTWPYHGTTTTLDALYMGVPVVTLAGPHHASRVGASLLAQVGLAELVAKDEDAYVAICCALAADRPRLNELRRDLRSRLLASPLCDAAGFTRRFEQALRGMWLNWCRERGRTLSADESVLAAFQFTRC